MKAFIQKIFGLLKSLFVRLRVMLTLQFGRDEVDEDKDSHEDESNNSKGG